MLYNALHALRAWVGLANPVESRLTPGHGWLLPSIVDARRHVVEVLARRTAAASRRRP
jgi:hypothetical protein